ncbi:phage portal protein [Methylobacterium sp. UNC378MF]|uniref:Phage portal protein n=1 Tax=Methylobacterium oryzae TaxID=334852 RepID=A0ABU7TMI7_9HYPH
MFRNWARTTNCDASRTETLGFMASELLTSTIVSGSGVAVPYYLPENGLTRFGTCFRVVEADRLSNPEFAPDTATRRRGIELDPETGAPKGYCVPRSPGGRRDPGPRPAGAEPRHRRRLDRGPRRGRRHPEAGCAGRGGRLPARVRQGHRP